MLLARSQHDMTTLRLRTLALVALTLLAQLVAPILPAIGQDEPTPDPFPVDAVSNLPDADGVVTFRRGLAIDGIAWAARADLHADTVEALIATGGWAAPQAGDLLTAPDGKERTWAAVTADEEDTFNIGSAYLFATVECDAPRAMVIGVAGASAVYVNGEPRVGDVYSTGWTQLPILLRAGVNEFLFRCGRGTLRTSMRPATGVCEFNTSEAVVPDFVVGVGGRAWASVLVLNTTGETMSNLVVHASRAIDGALATITTVDRIPPFSMRKVGFVIDGGAPHETGEHDYALDLYRRDDTGLTRLAQATIKTRVRATDQVRWVTFISDIDGSVQHYAVRPAVPLSDNDPPPALILSLHGAAVKAAGNARAYGPSSWRHIVAPTNRRPFGFDWEDWGRVDAMEALAHAEATLVHDPSRIYLSGHSMGGHGTWQLGAIFPDRWAAIGPSAGWCSFWSYASATPGEGREGVRDLLFRSVATSDTLSMSRNYLHHGVYIVHGGADNNVPTQEARNMYEHLKAFHEDVRYHEQPDAGHWWGSSDEPGSECMDWPPMMDFLARHRLASDAETRDIEFVTVNPGVSASSRWVTIVAPEVQHRAASFKGRCDPNLRRITATTDNVARLSLSVAHLAPTEVVTLIIDDVEIAADWPTDGVVHLIHGSDGTWLPVDGFSAEHKGPARFGPFKSVFDNRVILVYGTQGDDAENAWAFAKARYDAEQFWYRGNGAIAVVSDSDFLAAREAGFYVDCSVVLVGNADTNAAWSSLLGESPIQVNNGKVTVGDRVIESHDRACLFIRPRPGSTTALVGAISGTGIVGMRLTDRLLYFVSGINLPDWTVYGPDLLTRASEGVMATGFFGLDWSLENGESAWQ